MIEMQKFSDNRSVILANKQQETQQRYILREMARAKDFERFRNKLAITQQNNIEEAMVDVNQKESNKIHIKELEEKETGLIKDLQHTINQSNKWV